MTRHAATHAVLNNITQSVCNHGQTVHENPARKRNKKRLAHTQTYTNTLCGNEDFTDSNASTQQYGRDVGWLAAWHRVLDRNRVRTTAHSMRCESTTTASSACA